MHCPTSRRSTTLTLAGVVQAGAVPIDTYATLAEIMSTWNRPDAMAFVANVGAHRAPIGR
ncbi:hypothetical protein [Candidatus Nitrotoga arctica]|uniref:hypothetical protein n=1 Tax=Candidatus Nitrotoga arctica TaxID=453162 RepID=UPI001EFB15A6|nr:hypothetical protein [Candidatus Nitrotoga arctica]